MDEKQVTALVEQIVRGAKGHSGCCGKHKMTLQKARALTSAVEERAREMGVNAVIAVADAGGNPVSVQAMDSAYLASWDVALQKSYTVVALKMSTAELAKLAVPGSPLYGIQFTNQGKIVIFGGGEPLEGGGKIVGGLGVSGGTAEQDTALAAYGRQKFKEISEC